MLQIAEERGRAGGEGRGHGKERSTVTTYTRLHGNYHTRTSDNAVPLSSYSENQFVWSICAVQHVGDEASAAADDEDDTQNTRLSAGDLT